MTEDFFLEKLVKQDPLSWRGAFRELYPIAFRALRAGSLNLTEADAEEVASRVSQRSTATNQLSNTPPNRDGLIHAEVQLRELTGNDFQLLRKIGPFGMGNPAPVFLTRGVSVNEVRTMGAKGQHLRLKLSDNGLIWNAVAFQQTWKLNANRIDIIYTLGMM